MKIGLPQPRTRSHGEIGRGETLLWKDVPSVHCERRPTKRSIHLAALVPRHRVVPGKCRTNEDAYRKMQPELQPPLYRETHPLQPCRQESFLAPTRSEKFGRTPAE